MQSGRWSRELLSICVVAGIVLIILLSLFLLPRIISTSSPTSPANDEYSLITAMQGYHIAKNEALKHFDDFKLLTVIDTGLWKSPVINGTSFLWEYFFLSPEGKFFVVKTDSSDPSIVIMDNPLSPEGLEELQDMHTDADWKCDSDAAAGTAISLYRNITGTDPEYVKYDLENVKNSTTGTYEIYWIIRLFGDNYPSPDNGMASNFSDNPLIDLTKTMFANYSKSLDAYVDAENGTLLYYDYTNRSS